jgi:hypothetical protein
VVAPRGHHLEDPLGLALAGDIGYVEKGRFHGPV